MDNFKQFFYNDTEIQIYFDKDNEPWWVGVDICNILEHANPTKALSRLDYDEKLTSLIVRSGQKRSVTLINEPGLYELILTSRLPKAKEFKKWIKKEVLPQIRKTGSFNVKQLTSDEKIDLLIESHQKQKQQLAIQAERIEEMAPKELFHDTVTASNEWMPLGHFGKISGIGKVNIFKKLQEEGYLYWDNKRRIPNENYKKLLILKETSYEDKDGERQPSTKVYVSSKGQAYFTSLLCSSGQLRLEGK